MSSTTYVWVEVCAWTEPPSRFYTSYVWGGPSVGSPQAMGWWKPVYGLDPHEVFHKSVYGLDAPAGSPEAFVWLDDCGEPLSRFYTSY